MSNYYFLIMFMILSHNQTILVTSVRFCYCYRRVNGLIILGETICMNLMVFQYIRQLFRFPRIT